MDPSTANLRQHFEQISTIWSIKATTYIQLHRIIYGYPHTTNHNVWCIFPKYITPCRILHVRFFFDPSSCNPVTVWPDWAIFALWAMFKSLWQHLFCPNRPHFRQFLQRCQNLLFFWWNHFWATFIDIWRLFTCHTVMQWPVNELWTLV